MSLVTMPTIVGQQIAERTLAAVAAMGLVSAHYPVTGELPVTPTLLLYLTDFDITYGQPDQHWALTYTGQLLVSDYEPTATSFETHLGLLDDLIQPISDAWDPYPGNPNFQLGGLVDHCMFQPEFGAGGRMGQAMFTNGKFWLGGLLSWSVAYMRIAGA